MSQLVSVSRPQSAGNCTNTSAAFFAYSMHTESGRDVINLPNDFPYDPSQLSVSPECVIYPALEQASRKPRKLGCVTVFRGYGRRENGENTEDRAMVRQAERRTSGRGFDGQNVIQDD